MAVSTHTDTTVQRATSVGCVLDNAANGAHAAPAGRAPAAKPAATRAVCEVELRRLEEVVGRRKGRICSGRQTADHCRTSSSRCDSRRSAGRGAWSSGARGLPPVGLEGGSFRHGSKHQGSKADLAAIEVPATMLMQQPSGSTTAARERHSILMAHRVRLGARWRRRRARAGRSCL